MDKSSPTKQDRITVLLGFAFLAVILLLMVYTVRLFVDLLGTVQSQVAVAIVAGSFAASASIISLIIAKYWEARAVIRQEHRAKKIPVYEELIGLYFKFIYASKLGDQQPTNEQFVRDFVSLTQKLVVWASDDVIRAYSTFRTASGRQPSNEEILRIQEELFLAIRRDLGHDNKLPPGTLLRLFVNN